MKRAIEDILSSIVTYKKDSYAIKLETAPLSYVLGELPFIYKDQLKEITNMTYHSPEQSEAKKKMPLYYSCGTFKNTHAYDNNVDKESNLMTIDIDAIDNPDIDMIELQKQVFELPFVAVCLKSCSGAGLYAIIPIENYKCTKYYFYYLKKLFRSKFNVELDSKAKNIARARYISYNENVCDWIKKDDVEVFNLTETEDPDKKNIVKNEEIFQYYSIFKTYDDNNNRLYEAVKKVIDHGYHAENYGHWYYTGCDLVAIDPSGELFERFSRNGKWDDSQAVIDRKFKECMKNPTPIDNEFKRKWFGLAKRYTS